MNVEGVEEALDYRAACWTLPVAFLSRFRGMMNTPQLAAR
jgi:hypothetical protein